MNGAIIGLGHGKRVFVEAFKLSKINLIGVYSRNKKKAIDYAIKKKLKKKYKSVDEIIFDTEVEVIAIAIPAYYQMEIIKKCILNKKKIFCEKPIVVDFNILKKNQKLLSNYNKQFVVDYIFQEHDAFKRFKSIIPKNIPKNSTVDVTFNTLSYTNAKKIKNWKNFPLLGGGIINLYLPHILDYLVFLFGPISKLKNLSRKKNYIDIIYILKNGIKANIVISSNEKNREHSIAYQDSKISLILKNNSKDYAKNFFIKQIYKNKNIEKIILYQNKINFYKGDGRIYLVMKLLKKYFNNKINKKDYDLNFKKYFYIESLIDKVRKKYNSI